MNTRNITFIGEFSEANAAQFKVANVPAFAATTPAASYDTGRVLRLAIGLSDLCCGSHNYFVLNGKPS